MVNVFEIIKKDHNKIREILDDLQHLTARSKKSREQKFMSLKEILLPHMHAEEELFYPTVLNEGKDHKLIYEALEEHRAAQMVLADVESTPVSDEKWDGYLKVLFDLIDHHLTVEESDIFNIAREFIDSNRAKEIGQQFLQLKQESMAMKVK